MPATALDDWFTAEILPHEAALMRYLGRVWPRRAEHLDLRQDIYVRIYEAAATTRPANPRAFLFATARNLLTDRVRHNRIISIDSTQDFDTLHVLVDELSRRSASTPCRSSGAWPRPSINSPTAAAKSSGCAASRDCLSAKPPSA